MSLRESEDAQKKVASLGSNARTMKLPERIEKAIIEYSDAHGTNCSLDCDDLRTLHSAILAALDEARDGARDKLAQTFIDGANSMDDFMSGVAVEVRERWRMARTKPTKRFMIRVKK